MPTDFDKEIARLEREKAAAKQAEEDAFERDMRRAFWLGTAAPVLVFLRLVAAAIVMLGR